MTPDALENLLNNPSWMLTLARAVVRSPSDAEDVVQEARLVALTRPRPGDDARRWLRGVVRRVAFVKLRGESRRRARVAASQVGTPASADSAAKTAEVREVRALIAEAVLALSPDVRDAVLLRYFAGLEPGEIATRHGTSASTVRSRLQRGLQSLRDRLERHRAEPRTWLLPLLGGGGFGADLGMVAQPSSMPSFPRGRFWSWGIVAGLIFVTCATGWWLLIEAGTLRPDPAPAAPLVADLYPPEEERATAPKETPLATTPFTAAERALVLLSVRVLDDLGQPLIGSRVIFQPRWFPRGIPVNGDLARYGAVEDRTRETGVAGAMVPRSIPEWGVVVDATGFEPRACYLVAGLPRKVSLDRGGMIEGRITDPEGVPVLGARVAWRSVHCGVTVERADATDADGRFSLGGVTAPCPPEFSVEETSWIEVHAAGFAPMLVVPAPRELASRRRVDLTLERGERLSGRVVDSQTRQGVSGARAMLVSDPLPEFTEFVGPRTTRCPESPWIVAEVISDADGAFAFANVPPRGGAMSGDGVRPWRGPLRLVVLGAGRVPRSVPLTAAAGLVVIVDLERGLEIRGRVVKDDGTPCPGLFVRVAEPPTGAPWPEVFDGHDGVTRTDSQGAYCLRGVAVPAGGRVRLRARPRNALLVEDPEVVVFADRPGEVMAPDLWLPRCVPGRVTVVDAEGRPQPGALLFLAPHAVWDSQFSAVASHEGSVAIDLLEPVLPNLPTTVAFSVFCLGNPICTTRLLSLEEVRAGNVTVCTGSAARLEGTVIAPSGAPLPAATVRAWLSPALEGAATPTTAATDEALTNDVGVFVLPHLVSGTFDVEARATVDGVLLTLLVRSVRVPGPGLILRLDPSEHRRR